MTDLRNKAALVTGASRGIGASVARLLAERGANVIINYRSKSSRAEEVAAVIQSLGRRAVLAQADVTQEADLQAMKETVTSNFSQLDILVLNASGGLEKDKSAEYAMQLNRDAQVRIVEVFAPIMAKGGCVVFVTSHWAHFYGQKPVYKVYEIIAVSKRAGEDALRARIPELAAGDIRLIIVSGDMIEGTITPKLLERAQRGLLTERRHQVGKLPTVEEFAEAIVNGIGDSNVKSGDVIFVGSTD
jgi:NAD(P)-dependent dehydrogenase (short-subunit alcohol dehydrogenase family)